MGLVGRTLTQLDPLTLEPRGRRVELAEFHDGWSFSPSGSQVALGMGSPGVPVCGAGICVVDLDSMRIVQDIDGPIAAEAVGWVSRRRIAAVLQGGIVLVADPVRGEIVRQRTLAGRTYAPQSAVGAGRFVALVGGRAPRLLAVDRAGHIRTARLGRLDELHRPERSGVTIDPVARRALVLAAKGLVAEVDLRSMRVRYHRLRESATSAGRADAEIRCAEWLGGGRAVAFGEAVRVVDTKTWTARTLPTRADQAAVAGGRLLAYTGRYSDERRGVGLRVYTLDGRRLVAHRFGDQALNLQVAGAYAYAVAPRSVRIVRARTGRLVHEASREPPGYTAVFSGRSGSGFCEY